MNTFGNNFRISIFGESHGPLVGITIDNCPPGIPLSESDFGTDINRRKAGKPGTTARTEEDIPQLVSGVHQGHTTGSPLTIIFKNNKAKPDDYKKNKEIPRPGHADFVAEVKYAGFSDVRGGGHFSGRLTLPLVAAGVIAKKICKDISIQAVLTEAGGFTDIETAVDKAVQSGDSIGGVVLCCAKNVPVGLGEPFFYSVESAISQLVFSIPAIKGIEFGSGFESARMTGSMHNDIFIDQKGKTITNNSGGVNGGITNGNELIFRVAVKPASSIGKPQQTMNLKTGKEEILQIIGRHDACIAIRVPVVIEAVTAIVLADFLLTDKIRHITRY